MVSLIMADSVPFDILVVILASAAILGVCILHLLLFRAYRNEEMLHQIRLIDLQKLVDLELERSKKFAGNAEILSKQKEETQEKLDLIKLQLEALKKGEKGG